MEKVINGSFIYGLMNENFIYELLKSLFTHGFLRVELSARGSHGQVINTVDT